MYGDSSINKFAGPLRGIALIGTGAGVATILMHFVSWNTRLLFMLLMGIAFIGLLAVVYRQVAKAVRKRKSQKFEAELAGTGPVGRRQDLGDRFREGIQKLREAKVDVYSMPWYVVVGESGSGKTEAIRNSRLQFPLNDHMQGTGGTADMHWWITDEAVLLDTAGRLFLHAENDRLSQDQWSDFLKLLRHTRPQCPITGLLLVVPADKLISDPAEDLARKARDTAEQLRRVQAALDVRFPVFVVITKADLVTGFREYFDSLDDIDLQHQMIGWSNPEDLDTPFDPRKLSEMVTPLIERVREKRRELLQDPRPQHERGRLAEVDALYDFPSSLGKLVPRLRHYLESVFAGTNLTAKPLFCRGIYFTSSLSQGAALDEELAQAMNIPVEQLPGDGWKKERSYFLRDVFREKIFRERGLVTQATNARNLYRRRKLIVLGACFLAIGVLLGITVWAAKRVKDSVGDLALAWMSAANTSTGWIDKPYFQNRTDEGAEALVPHYLAPPVRPVGEVGGPYEYSGILAFDTDGDRDREPLAAQLRCLHRLADRPIEVPWIFSWIPMGDEALGKLRTKGMAIVRDAAIVAPLLDACRETAAREATPPWDDRDRDVLDVLFQVELHRLGLAAYSPRGDEEGAFPFVKLAEYAIARSGSGAEARLAEWSKAASEDSEDKDGLVAAVRDIMESDKEWPARVALGLTVADGKLARNRPLQVLLERYVAHYADPEVLWPTAAGAVGTGPGGEGNPVRQWEAFAGLLRTMGARRRETDASIGAARTQGQALLALAKAQPFADVSWDRADSLCPVTLDEARALIEGWSKGSAQYGAAVAAATKAVEDLRASGRDLADARRRMPGAVQWDSASFLAAFEDWLRKELRADAPSNPLFAAIPALARFMETEFPAEGAGEARQFQQWLRELARERLEATRATLLERMKKSLGEAGDGAADLDDMWRRAVESGEDLARLVEPYPAALAEEEAARKAAALAVLDAGISPEARRKELGAALAGESPLAKAAAEAAVVVLAVEDGRRNAEAMDAAQRRFPDSVGKLADWGVAEAKPRARDLPALPFTNLAQFRAEPGYDPAAAQAILGAVRPALAPPGGRLVACETVEEGQDAIRRTAEGYVNDYSEYWLDLYDTGHRCVPAGDWERTGEAIGGIRLRDIRDFAEIFAPSMKALDETRAAFRGPRAPEGAPATTFLTEDEQTVQIEAATTYSLLASREYRDWEDDLDDVLRNWRSLARRAAGEARRTMLRMTPDELERTYWIPRLPRDFRSPHFLEKYWRNWTSEALEAMAEAARQEIGQQIREVRGRYDRFPLALPRPGVAPLTPDQCKEARGVVAKALAQLRATPDEGARDGFAEGSVGAGAEGELPGSVRSALQKLRAAGTVDAEDLAWLERALELLDAVASAQCTFTLPTARLEDIPNPAYEAWFVFRLFAGGATAWVDYRLGERAGFRRDFPAAAEGLVLEFNQHKDAGPNHAHYRSLPVQQAWAPLRMLYGGDNGKRGTERIQWSGKYDPIGKRWVLTVHLLTPDNHAKQAVLYLVFPRELPAWFREQVERNQVRTDVREDAP